MYYSLKLHSLPLSNSQIVEQTANIDHREDTDVCKMANRVDSDNHKRVRFDMDVDNNNDNNAQQHNAEGKRVWNHGVGMCKSSFEGSNVEI